MTTAEFKIVEFQDLKSHMSRLFLFAFTLFSQLPRLPYLFAIDLQVFSTSIIAALYSGLPVVLLKQGVALHMKPEHS